MPKYTLQESFDKMVRHAATMTSRSKVVDGPTCLYRQYDQEGAVCNMCFVGALIDETLYHKGLEDMPADEAPVILALEGSGHIGSCLWSDAQQIHDCCALGVWEGELRGLAKRYKLKFPEDVKFPVLLPQ